MAKIDCKSCTKLIVNIEQMKALYLKDPDVIHESHHSVGGHRTATDLQVIIELNNHCLYKGLMYCIEIAKCIIQCTVT